MTEVFDFAGAVFDQSNQCLLLLLDGRAIHAVLVAVMLHSVRFGTVRRILCYCYCYCCCCRLINHRLVELEEARLWGRYKLARVCVCVAAVTWFGFVVGVALHRISILC